MREEILYTPEEIAQKLKLSKYTIYEMIKRGEIPAHRIGRSLRVTQSQLDAYLKQSRRSENTFEAEAITIDGEQFAKVIGSSKDLYISIASEIEGSVKLTIKPEDVILALDKIVCSARNMHDGVITAMEENENSFKITVNVGVPLAVSITKRSVEDMDLKLGDKVYAIFKTMAVIVV